MSRQSRQILPDEVWDLVEPLLPEPPLRPKGGRPATSDRNALTGVLFVLKTGIAWEDLPQEMGCGCGMTCLRRLREWRQTGVWERIQPILQQHVAYARRVDWTRAGNNPWLVFAAPGRPSEHLKPLAGLRRG